MIEGKVDFVGFVHLPALDLGHLAAKRFEIVHPGLVHQNIAVRQEQNALFSSGLPEPPDNLKGDKGLARAGGHDEQEAVLSLGNGFHRPVDGDFLIIARNFVRSLRAIILGGHRGLFWGESFPRAIALP